MAQKRGEYMDAKKGRPKVDNPKTIEIKARIDTELNNLLMEYCKENNMTRTDIVRKGIELVLKQK